MSTFESLLYHGLTARMEAPGLYGAWHIVSILLTVALTVCMVRFFRDAKDSTMRTLVFVGWILMVLFEIGKQLIGAMEYDGTTLTWSYYWHWFPFQFCSTPMYTFPFVFLMKDCKFRRAIMAYIATFSLFAGIIVMILPTTVFGTRIFTNVQTMVHHGLQVVFGVYMASYNRHHLGKRFFAWCMMVFGGFSAVAMILNLTLYPIVKENSPDFNLFYISPFVNNDLPVLSAIYPKVPYPVYLIIYIGGFTLVAAIVYAIEKGIAALMLRKHKRAKDHISH
ncbi:MAG: YwaF family protein [Clostridia bacterium]|nr:YwaF family protein [Clostridia bacterium]